jgi:amino-acid N-acetyltransferase
MLPFDSAQFVAWFRSVAPYVYAHRGKVCVIACRGAMLARERFLSLAQDLNLLNAIGVSLVLVYGARPQIDAELARRGLATRFARGFRVTDAAAMEVVKQVVGGLRIDIESMLSSAPPDSPMAGAELRLAGGNFVVGRPLGVVGGEDFLFSGEVRRIDVASIRTALTERRLVLLDPLGYSPSGEVFNLDALDLAAATAGALGADKLVYLLDAPGLVAGDGQLLRELTAAEAERRFVRFVPEELDRATAAAVRAIRAGVGRAHLLSEQHDGATVLELFTHSGVGSMISQDPVERIRQAGIEDIAQLLRLLEPLEADGTLVRRGRALLEREIDRFSVLEHDGRLIGCAALYPFPAEAAAELAGLAVHAEFRGAGRGERLLRYVEQRAGDRDVTRLFVLTTRAAHWFSERGFHAATPAALPRDKQLLYNYQRRSKVLAKDLGRRAPKRRSG